MVGLGGGVSATACGEDEEVAVSLIVAVPSNLLKYETDGFGCVRAVGSSAT
jgi:hypothetical protein